LPFHGKQLTASFVSFCAMYTWIFCRGLELNNYYRNIILSKYTQRLQTTAKNIFFKSYSWLFYYVYLWGLPNVQGLLATLIGFVANKYYNDRQFCLGLQIACIPFPALSTCNFISRHSFSHCPSARYIIAATAVCNFTYIYRELSLNL